MTPIEQVRIDTTIPEMRWRLERLISNMLARGFIVHVDETRGPLGWYALDRAAHLLFMSTVPGTDGKHPVQSFRDALREAAGDLELHYADDGQVQYRAPYRTLDEAIEAGMQ